MILCYSNLRKLTSNVLDFNTISLIDSFFQLLSSRRSPSVYKVTNSQGKVVSLCLFKSSYRLGEDIIGTLDFSDGVVSCMQVSPTRITTSLYYRTSHLIIIVYIANFLSEFSYWWILMLDHDTCVIILKDIELNWIFFQYSVTLQSQEIVPEEKRRRLGNAAPTAEETTIVSHTKHHEFSVGFLQTHMSLPVPLYVTPSFDTDLIVLKWRLHFEFVTAVKAIDWKGESQWQPPQVTDIETMVWDFPIVIYPTAPAHVSKAFYSQRDATMAI